LHRNIGVWNNAVVCYLVGHCLSLGSKLARVVVANPKIHNTETDLTFSRAFRLQHVLAGFGVPVESGPGEAQVFRINQYPPRLLGKIE